MQWLIGLIGGLVAMLFYNVTKRKDAEAIVQNAATVAAANKIEDSVTINNAAIAATQEASQAEADKVKQDENSKPTTSFLADRK